MKGGYVYKMKSCVVSRISCIVLCIAIYIAGYNVMLVMHGFCHATDGPPIIGPPGPSVAATDGPPDQAWLP